MPILIYDLKREYNQLLAREKKADLFMDDDKIEQSKKQEWLPEYKSITDRLAYLLCEIRFYTAENIVHGFSESECIKPANSIKLAQAEIKQLKLGV